MAELNKTGSTDAPVNVRRRRWGCWIPLLGVWFVCALIPCLAITLATQEQFTIQTGSIPEQEVRVWLVMAAQQRGIGYSVPSVIQTNELQACVQTDVRYLLWAGSGEATTYCDCYVRDSADQVWSMSTTQSGACPR